MELVSTVNLAAGIDHVGEDHGWTEEDVIFQVHAAVDRDIVLDLDLVSNLGIRSDEHILTDIAVLADASARHNVAEMPNLGAGADFSALVDEAGFMYEVFTHASPVQVRVTAVF